jgi:hypothetical protein
MEPNDMKEQSTTQAVPGQNVPLIAPCQDDVVATPAGNAAPCPTCAGAGASMPVSFVYAIGRIEARYPNLSVEKEFAQVAGQIDTAGKTDQQTFHAVLSKNRYLVRELCWVLTIQGLETYLLVPRDSADFERLVEAIRPVPSRNNTDVVIGVRGPIAPPEMCNGLMVPIVLFDQIYSFDCDALIKAIPKPKTMTTEQFGRAAEQMFNLMQMADNAGATDADRVKNFLLVRHPGIYVTAAEEFGKDFSLTGVEVRPSPLSGTRVEVIFSFRHRKTDFPEKFCVQVDKQGKFPFLVTKMLPYYDR